MILRYEPQQEPTSAWPSAAGNHIRHSGAVRAMVTYFIIVHCAEPHELSLSLSSMAILSNSSRCLRIHMILTVWSYVTLGHEKTVLLLSWQRGALPLSEAVT
jgi:hypothetical protein